MRTGMVCICEQRARGRSIKGSSRREEVLKYLPSSSFKATSEHSPLTAHSQAKPPSSITGRSGKLWSTCLIDLRQALPASAQNCLSRGLHDDPPSNDDVYTGTALTSCPGTFSQA